MLERFKNNLQRLHNSPPLFPSTPLAIALSGGSDSMALALLARQAGLPLSTFTIDHQLRAESAVEATQVAEWMKRYDIPHAILKWQHDAQLQGNLQAFAREARYQLLTEACKSRGIKHLLIGHTEDDQAETIAYRQERLAGPVGLAGISARTHKNGVTILRPLLNISRNALREYLQQQNQPWVDDPSNENTDFARIRIRQQLATNPSRKQNLLALGTEMAAKRQALERDYNNWCGSFVSTDAAKLHLSQHHFTTLSEEAACYALSRLLPAVSGRHYPPRYTELQRLHQQMQAPQGKATLGHCIIKWENGQITLSPEHISPKFSAKPLVAELFFTI